MKKFLYKLFVGIGVVLMVVFYTIAAAVCYPYHLFKYRKSDFYRETGIPFSAAKDTSDLHLYRLFREENVPIRYLPPMDLRKGNGWFFLGNTLLLHMFDELSFSEALGGWTLFPDDTLPLADTVAEQLRLIRELEPNVQIDQVRILLERIEVDPAHLQKAEADSLFLIYSDHQELLRKL